MCRSATAAAARALCPAPSASRACRSPCPAPDTGAMVTIQVSQVTQRTISPNPASRLRTKKTAMSSVNAIAAMTAVEPNALKARLADGPTACSSAGTNREAARIASQGAVANRPIDCRVHPLVRQRQRHQRRQGADLNRLAERGRGIDRREAAQAGRSGGWCHVGYPARLPLLPLLQLLRMAVHRAEGAGDELAADQDHDHP